MTSHQALSFALQLAFLPACNLLVELPTASESSPIQEVAPPDEPELPSPVAPPPAPAPGRDAGAIEVPPPPPLEDTNLVARYFLDDYAGGELPQLIWDTSAEPEPLFVDPGDGLSFVSAADGHGGLQWDAIGSGGGGWNVGGYVSKTLTRLDANPTFTVEAVLDVREARQQGSDLYAIVSGMYVHLALIATPTRYFLLLDGSTVAGDWTVQHEDLGRTTLHVVVDTVQEEPEARVRLYADGELLPASPAHLLAKDSQLALPSSAMVIVGSAERSIRGALHYVATYDSALSESRIRHHAEALAANDDRPGL